MTKRPVIVLEFNELTPALMDRFIGQGHLPGFAKLRSESIACITTPEEQAPNLEPWIQWVSVHTGLSYQEHQVFLLGDGRKLKAPRLWDMVADAGERAWICGSMNAAVQSKHAENLFILPDPWAIDIEPKPAGMFDAFYRLVSTYVQEYTREKVPLAKGDYLRFVRFMVANGLSPKTVIDTLRQLAGERGDGGSGWKRATILDRLQWDVFRHNYRKLKPAVSTFFSNSTAHFQHFYWRNMEPERFALQDTSTRETGLEGAILLGYQKMDRLVQECMTLAGDEATIVFCTALGAQPLVGFDDTGGREIVRVTDMDALLRYAGVTQAYEFNPAMSAQFHLMFGSEGDAAAAHEKIKALRLDDGSEVMMAVQTGDTLYCGVELNAMPPVDAKISSRFANQARQFHELFYLANGIKSGMHHPDGLLWIRTPERRHLEVERKVSLREVAPTILALAGVKSDHKFALPPMAEVREPAMA